MKTSRSEYVDVCGLRYHVRRWGREGGPRLLLLHGWMDCSASFQFMVDALAQEWDIVAPDWRGFGLSERQYRPYWFPEYIGDLDALLQHYSPDGPARLVGHSMGGNIACLYAGVRPERVRQLANLEGFGLAPNAADEAPARYARWLNELRVEPRLRKHADLAALAGRLREQNPRLSESRALFLAGHFGEAVDDGVMVRADPWHRLVNPVVYRIRETMACWRKVEAPVLWVVGADSKLLQRFAAYADHYRERIACFRNLREVTIADAGHMLQHDQPEQLAREIESFFLA